MASSASLRAGDSVHGEHQNEEPPMPSRTDQSFFSAEETMASAGVATQLHLDMSLDFKPFFTLVEDTQTGEHHHPNVYYVFQDDDPDVVVSATLSALESAERKEASGIEDEIENERIVIIDMAANGRQVERAVSISPHWQSLAAQVSPAPSWADASRETERGLMLTISGRENIVVDRRPDPAKARTGEHVEMLIHNFEQRLDELHAVMGRHVNEENA